MIEPMTPSSDFLDPPPPAGPTVLVVEDDSAVRKIVQLILSREGYHVLAAPLGTEAIHLSDEHEAAIHLLITDLIMPGLDGSALAGMLGLRRPDMKVLFISGVDLLPEPFRDNAQYAYLPKPFSPANLLAAVHQLLGDRPGAVS